jgi:hypothetical protein
MTPSIWSVLIIFVAAPLAVAGLVTTIVLLTTSRPRPSAEADQAAPEIEDQQEYKEEDEASDSPDDANDAGSAAE